MALAGEEGKLTTDVNALIAQFSAFTGQAGAALSTPYLGIPNDKRGEFESEVNAALASQQAAGSTINAIQDDLKSFNIYIANKVGASETAARDALTQQHLSENLLSDYSHRVEQNAMAAATNKKPPSILPFLLMAGVVYWQYFRK